MITNLAKVRLVGARHG